MRQSKGLSLEEFGRPLNYSKALISRLERGEVPLSRKFIARLIEVYGVNRRWLEDGDGEPFIVAKEKKETTLREEPQPYRLREEMKIGQIQSLKKERGEVAFLPVVSWASAGKAHDFQEMQGFIDEEVRSTAKNPHCFALRVEGDSMEPRYLAGDLVVLDPHREARNGNRVVARLKDSEGVLFKVYNVAGDDVTLVSYNSMYPPLKFKRKDFLWIYPVIETIRKEPM